MKLLLDEIVYEVPTEALMAWVNMTPKFRDEFRDGWKKYMKRNYTDRKPPNKRELDALVKRFYTDHQDWYFQIMFEAAMDMRKAMGVPFEDYKSDMTVDELIEYADKPGVGSFAPMASQPIRIDVEPDSGEAVEIKIN